MHIQFSLGSLKTKSVKITLLKIIQSLKQRSFIPIVNNASTSKQCLIFTSQATNQNA